MTYTEAFGERVPWRAVAVFVATAFCLAWLVTLPLWLGEGLSTPLAVVLLPLMMLTPAVATLVACLALRVPGRGERLRGLGIRPLPPVRTTVAFLVAAIVVPPVIVAAALLLAAALGLVRLDLTGFSGFAAQLEASGVDLEDIPVGILVAAQLAALPVAAILNSVLAFGEELGWRGWLLPALRPLGTWPALLASGAIWGLWHAPVILLGYNFGRPDVMGLLVMVGGCVAWGVLLGWTRLRAASLWPAVLAHGALNAAAGLPLLLSDAGATPDLALAGPLGVTAWIVLAAVVALIAVRGGFRERPVRG